MSTTEMVSQTVDVKVEVPPEVPLYSSKQPGEIAGNRIEHRQKTATANDFVGPYEYTGMYHSFVLKSRI